MPRIIVLITIAFIFARCKENPAGTAKPDNQTTSNAPINKSANVEAFYPMLNQVDLSSMEVAAFRKSAQDIVHHRNKELADKTSAILTKDAWKYDGIFKGSQFTAADSLKNKWIKFKDNLTYQYGENAEVRGGGMYTYNFDTGLLLMLDNDPNLKPNEYNVKVHNDLVILEGQATYQDNNIQAKLVRIKDFVRE